ncbi:hypothetical protein N7468_007374 [Penicillium chermesinum]|uniref:AB hydrolase-1 domain-containing protein n=1 Tax=Penicillium chermesinum TaxID=63820 RepID=A0A9W9NWW7_9EURO|nr:uncharacterized protein N7468_007374 [Penicillium chermesinum]KAJ5226149.1 hypothetical protein N7468_007374 [Penicillium chermesinum]
MTMADFEYISLTTKPSAKICFRFHDPISEEKPVLIVFLNGLGLPQEAWSPTITRLKELRQSCRMPAILTYDRYGQGLTIDRDPNDAGAVDPTKAHDAVAVIQDLRQLIVQVASARMGITDISHLSLVFVANSIGCALGRLFAQEYPGLVAALLLLDSYIANTDFVSAYPDPDAPGFDPSTLPRGVTPENLHTTREGMRRLFHPDGGKRPFVVVIGHDFDVFAAETTRMGATEAVTNAYLNPYWHKYNEGLAHITDPDRSRGPIQAPNAGHFIQRDNPDLVAHELDTLLRKLS